MRNAVTFPSSTFMSSLVTSGDPKVAQRASCRLHGVPTRVLPRLLADADHLDDLVDAFCHRRPPLASSCSGPRRRSAARTARLRSIRAISRCISRTTSPEIGSVTPRSPPRSSSISRLRSRVSIIFGRRRDDRVHAVPFADQAEVALAGLDDRDRRHAGEGIAVDGAVRLEVVLVPPRLHPHAHHVVGCHGSTLPRGIARALEPGQAASSRRRPRPAGRSGRHGMRTPLQASRRA